MDIKGILKSPESRMLKKAGAPAIKKKELWHKPDILQWLNNLAKEKQLCAVNC